MTVQIFDEAGIVRHETLTVGDPDPEDGQLQLEILAAELTEAP